MSSSSSSSSSSPIKFFGTTCEFGCFSNMYPASFTINNKKYPTNEHFFQAKKFETTDPAYFETVRKAANPKSAKALGKSRKHPIRKDWNEARIDVMEEGLRAKFTQHENLKDKLLSTGEKELIENAPRDYFWGCGAKGSGQNKLGKMLMELRGKLRKGGEELGGDEKRAKKAKKEIVGEASPKAGKKK